MAKVGAQRAAELTGRSKSTIQRAMKKGTLSFEMDSNSRRLIDVSELDRVFGLNPTSTAESSGAAVEQELEKASAMLEAERMKMRIKFLEVQLENAEARIRDMLRNVRDSMKAGSTDVKTIKSFLDFEINTLSHLNTEIVDENLVQKGRLAEICEEAAGGKRRKL